MIRLLAFAFTVMASGVSAQELTVRSGEHDGFTRLVVQVPRGTKWHLEQQPEAARLSVALDDASFDTESVFTRLSNNRLTSLVQPDGDSALDIAFGCECIATAFLHQQRFIVVDISPDDDVTKATDTPAAVAATITDTKSPVSLSVELPSSDLVLPLTRLARNDISDQLAMRLLQGSDREIIDLQLAGVGPRRSVVELTGQGPLDPRGNLKFSSVLDEIQGLAVPQIETGPTCITNAELGFETWSDARPFAQQVAELRSGLFQEFDKANNAEMMALAKLYAYFGFGAEASQVLALRTENSKDHDWVLVIANVVDDKPQLRPDPFAGQQHCGGDAALWAVLTQKSLNSDANLDEIEQSFARLPTHMRRDLGPRLSNIFVAADKLEASRRILRSVGRIENANDPELVFAQAKNAEADGKDPQSESQLKQVIASPSAPEEAPLALARLIQKRWSDRGSVSQKELELAAAYSTELRRAKSGPMMERAYALALGLGQDFDGALDLVQKAHDTSEWLKTQDQILQLLAERADDITFLTHILNLSETGRGTLSIETAISISDRLTDLGFPASALAYSERSQDTARRFERARLRAKASVVAGRPHEALLALSEDRSHSAQKLRAQALMETGNYAQAATLLLELGDTDAAQRYFWLAGMTEDALSDPAGRFGNIARLSQEVSLSIEQQEDTPLANAALLLENSELAREQISQLLSLAGRDTQ